MNQEPESPDLDELLSDPNLLPSEREAIQHLLAVTVASEGPGIGTPTPPLGSLLDTPHARGVSAWAQTASM